MDDLLPSYESAIKQDPWELIARFLPSDDLCSAALVCQRWHEIFTPQLWGNPASHFGIQNDTVYVALTRFKRTLQWCRLSVRTLTHTLQLPPAHAELYGGPHSDWLRDCLERLPRLQCLIVHGLPFFDHASLLTLRHSSRWTSTRPSIFPVFGLRLLDASGCTNATSIGLAEALPHFPDLVSLDLSKTLAAKDPTVLSKMKCLFNLRVLRLKGLGLRDSDLAVIASSVSTRVRSLDVSENCLTDASARYLLGHCLKETIIQTHETRAPLPPVEDSRPHGELDAPSTDNLDSHLRKKLMQGFVGTLAIEDASDVGITHLFLSKNNISVEGISGILRSGRIRVLDVGTLPTLLHQSQPSSADKVGEPLKLPGVAKLTPIIAECASKLVYLRINYGIITEDAALQSAISPRAEIEGDLRASAPRHPFELDASDSPKTELESVSTAVCELPGDSMQPVELPSSSKQTARFKNSKDNSAESNTISAPAISITSEPEVKRGPGCAPEPIIESPLPPPPSVQEMNMAAYREAPNIKSVPLSPSPANSFVNDECASPQKTSKTLRSDARACHSSIVHVEDFRASLNLRQSQENRLHPGTINNVHTLVLTDVPISTRNRQLVDRLIQFITDAGEEAKIAKIRAKHTYILPPGRTRAVAEREYARSLFALDRIVLEMAPPETAPKKISTSWRNYQSSTEDADSEAFWQAATHDFSFFGDEECGLPTTEPGRPPPLEAMSGLILDDTPRRPALSPKPRQKESNFQPMLDVVAEIGKFRRERKANYENLIAMGESEPEVEGYWPGNITIVRKQMTSDSGDLDYYGNRYEGGWLYR